MTKTPINQNREVQTAAIEVSQLTVSYGPVPALLDISVTVEPGKLVGVIGPNGSGKSTLIKSILGFIKPDVGQVKNIWGKRRQRKRKNRLRTTARFGRLGLSNHGA